MPLPPSPSPAVEPEALITPAAPRFGLAPRTVRPTLRRIGVTPTGDWYLYGATPADADRTPVEAVCTPRILEIAVVTRAKTSSRFGPRPYLDVTMIGETPAIRYVLSLPCAYTDQRSGARLTPHSVRSLLGALLTLELANTPLKLEPNRGNAANFTNVYLDPEGLQQVRAKEIGDDECALQQAVDACRCKLGLPPQFTLADAAVQSSLDLDP